MNLTSIVSIDGIIAKGRIETMNRAFLEQQSGNTSGILIGIIVVALATAGLAFFIYKKRSERAINDSKLLFTELCRAHHLSRKQRRTLRDQARSKNLSDPSMMFLDSSLWVYDPARQTGKSKSFDRLLATQRLLFSVPKST